MASILKIDEIQHTNGTTALTIGTDGSITQPNTAIAFSAYFTEDLIRVDASKVDPNWAGVRFNRGNGFDSVNSQFVAPKAGIYQFTARVAFTSSATNIGDAWAFSPRLNGTVLDDYTNWFVEGYESGVEGSSQFTILLELSAGDIIDLYTQDAATTGITFIGGHFDGVYLGA